MSADETMGRREKTAVDDGPSEDDIAVDAALGDLVRCAYHDGRWSMPWPEYVAMRFHQAYEELAPLHGYETRRASAVPWVDVPEQNRDLMVDVVRRLLAEGVIRG